MTLKAPNVDTWNGPIDFIPEKKPKFKLKQDLRGYWYKYNPVNINTNTSLEPNYPVVYSFSRLENGSPNVSLLDLSLPESFTILCIQKKVPLSDLANIWKNLYPSMNEPNFNEILQNLMNSGFILYTAHM